MIIIQQEDFMDTVPELQTLFPLHYEELAHYKDKVPLDPDYAMYQFLEDLGRLLLVTVRDDGRLVGYFVGVVHPSLHYKTCLTCMMDMFFIHPEWRGKNLLGLKLFRFTEKILVEAKVQRWHVGCKLYADASAMFKRLGFSPIEIYHSKWIGE